MNIIDRRVGADLSEKYLLELHDGHTVEALYMRDKSRTLTYSSTVCVSSQVGCAIGCAFCATGRQGFVRNLEGGEIAGQVKLCLGAGGGIQGRPLDAVVFAGMGEPLLNYDGVVSAIEELRRDLGLTQYELATVGVVPRIRALSDFVVRSGIGIRLNISLHAATDEKRRRLIPLTERYGVRAILDAADAYAAATGTTARVRYMLIKGFNDTEEDAQHLRRLLSGRRLKLIISSYNDNHIEGLAPTDALDVFEFYNKMKDSVPCGIFKSFGAAIGGGCGQLRRIHHRQNVYTGDRQYG
jgi:23S rRNA (adenine2503-C2)-methyltransferase